MMSSRTTKTVVDNAGAEGGESDWITEQVVEGEFKDGDSGFEED